MKHQDMDFYYKAMSFLLSLIDKILFKIKKRPVCLVNP